MSQTPTEALYDAALAAFRGSRDAEAIALFRQLIDQSPRTPEYHNGLGTVLARGGLIHKARECFDAAVKLSPDFAAGYYNLGNLLAAEGSYEQAIAKYRRAIDLNPGSAESFNNLGTALLAINRPDEAIDAYKRALTIRPDLVAATLSLGSLLRDTGLVEQSIEYYRQFLGIRSDWRVGSGLLYSMLFHPAYDAARLFEAHARWDEAYARPLSYVPPEPIDCSENRRQRIGYVSTDFRQHVVGYNLLPLLQEHDHSRFEVVCYSNVATPDSMTDQFRELSDSWREIRGLDDRQAAEMIRRDRIDILIDTSLHMADHRLLVFAQKPAPVQVTFAGYPGTTGLRVMDYRLTDPFLDPPTQRDDGRYSERSIRLAHSFWCFNALGEPDPAVNMPPSVDLGYITFGYLGAMAKITEPTIQNWANVLRAVSNSRMMILAPPGLARERLLKSMSDRGVEATRVEFVGRQPRPQYLATYGRIDVFLDSFPYNGHSTALDALWMGVPVVTLTGDAVVSRAGLSILSNLELTDLVANDEEQFVRIATDLANDAARLAGLRATLRPRMSRSPLMDAQGMARDIEAAYRRMWDERMATQA